MKGATGYTAEQMERRPRGRCGKIKFDKRTAQTKRNALEREGRERLRIYSCDECDAWHLTSKIKGYL